MGQGYHFMLKCATHVPMYTYPILKTGTSQDLMSIVARAYERRMDRDGTVLPHKTAAQRTVLEVPFNAIGALLHAFASLLPAEWTLRLHDKLFTALASPHSYPFDASAAVLTRAAALVAEVEREAGRPAALVGLVSHPPVMGEMAHMNFELVRHAMLGLRVLRGRPCRPRLVAAVDLFALDTISIPEEGLYAGYMGLYHFGLDRLALGRGVASARLIARTAWHRMAHRLIRELGDGREAGMVLSGGVPATARVLYAAREWLSSQRRKSPLKRDPASVLRRLRSRPDYRSFEENGPCGQGLRKSAWRMSEGWVMAAMAGEGLELSPADEGALSAEVRQRLHACLDAMAIPAAEQPAAIELLAAEASRETPYRGRFFSVLAGRVLRRRPVVFLPIAHGVGAARGIKIRDAWAWRGGCAKALNAVTPSGAWQGDAESFAKAFVTENFQ